MEPYDGVYECANEVKTNFDDIYNLRDPRRYYRTLGELDYQIPTRARPVFRKVMSAIGRERICVVDIGCSYGVNAAMIKHDLDFADLVARYSDAGVNELSVAETILDDASFYQQTPVASDAAFAGVDVAEQAAGYAKAVGLIDETVTENLESGELSAHGREVLSGADLVITTGAVGYVTEKTFRRVIEAAAGPPPWVAAFCLRQFPFDAIAEALQCYGLQTEKLGGRVFPQRRFHDAAEQAGAVAAVESLGLDPSGLEADGQYYAEFYLAKPHGAPKLADLHL